jgi:hypothetical protein
VTPLEGIIATAVAIFGIWLLWPLGIVCLIVVAIGIVLAAIWAEDAWVRRKAAKQIRKRYPEANV